MNNLLSTAYQAALDGMQTTGPRDLQRLVTVLADLPDGTNVLEQLRLHLQSTGPEDPLRKRLAQSLAGWITGPPWTVTGRRERPETRGNAGMSLIGASAWTT